MSRADVVAELSADLAAEAAALQQILQAVPDSRWSTPTPAPGWTIHDQIAHLARFDEITRMAIAQPDEFAAFRDGLGDLQTYVDGVGAAYAHLAGTEKLNWWRAESLHLRDAIAAADPAARIPWFGPAMSLPSKISARIMETWAHGQDVADALGVERPATKRLRHIARIGVLALPNSFRAHGRAIPDTGVSVELVGPGGSVSSWGDLSSADSIRGHIVDFCLVVTQRRHLADTALDVRGPIATEWMAIAQAFAGPPGAGRRPGQFSIIVEGRSGAPSPTALEEGVS